MNAAQEPLERYFQAVAAVDAIGAIEIVMDLLESGAAPDQITHEVLGPAQVRVGDLWEQGVWSVADEHAATAVTETALAALAAATTRRTTAQRHVVMACAEGEWHTLPARMAASVVAAAGDVRVTMLGPSLPAEHLGRRLAAGDVDLLALSCTLPTNLIGAARSIAAAHAAGVPVIAGGRAFGLTFRRAQAVGADAWAADTPDLSGPVPGLTGIDREIPLEALLLDGVSDATVALAYDRMIGAFPRLEAMTPFQQARTRDDLRWMARFTAATVLTAEVTILDEFLSWLGRVLSSKVPVLATSAHLVADVVEPQAPVGSSCCTRRPRGLSSVRRERQLGRPLRHRERDRRSGVRRTGARAAMRDRLRRAEQEPGFGGLEVWRPVRAGDPYRMVTWWQDEQSSRDYMRSAAHAESHARTPGGQHRPRPAGLDRYWCIAE